MKSFPSEIRNYSAESLLELLNVYLVRSHDGKEFVRTAHEDEKEGILQFIAAWLAPDGIIISETKDPIQAIRNRIRFNPTSFIGEDIITQIFGSELEVSSNILEDFANYPLRDAFGYDAWDLLQGYVHSEDKDKFILQITQADPAKFLNNTEKIFYLTRGYGRPNHNISLKDAELRSFYGQAEPTALLALMDIFGICPTKQDPRVVREHLSDTTLISIDRFHYDAVKRITECLQGENKVQCFKNFLNSIGALPIYQYDPETRAFVSNLSQLSLYIPVDPDRKWNFDEIADQPGPYVTGVLKTLPDSELVGITSHELRFADEIDLNILDRRLRSKLLRSASQFLTSTQYFILPGEVLYGRLADKELVGTKTKDLVEHIVQLDTLIDIYDNIIPPETAQELNYKVHDRRLQNVINKTIERILANDRMIESMTPKQRVELRKIFENSLESPLDLDALRETLSNGPPEANKLILYTYRDTWIPLAIYFEEYFQDWQPRFRDTIKSTLEYYKAIL